MITANPQSDRHSNGPQPACIPAGLIDYAYIDGADCAAAAAMSISQWYALVKEEVAPQPVIRKPRFTRWLLSDVRKWLVDYRTTSDFASDSDIVLKKARKASKAAQDKAMESRQRSSRTVGVNHG